MKLRQRHDTDTLPADLRRTLTDMRAERAFDARRYLDAKCDLLNLYLQRWGLDSLVVAVSGGIDSAAVAAIVAAASTRHDSPLRHLTYVTLPVHDAVTGQDASTRRARAAMSDAAALAGTAVTVDELTIDCTAGFQTLDAVTRSATGTDTDPWARGQLAATVRTPVLYYLTSLHSAAGRSAAIAGTTNRSEGAYLGYVGKASDGMVDLQIISDAYKSEVYAIAELLDLDDEIRSVEPTGDMFDGAADVDVFGAPYDFVELYLEWRCWERERQNRELTRWDDESRDTFHRWAESLEALHDLNAHKYVVGSPAVHLDVLTSAVPGGWNPPRWQP